jgi:hypothetical protein
MTMPGMMACEDAQRTGATNADQHSDGMGRHNLLTDQVSPKGIQMQVALQIKSAYTGI